MANDEPKYYTEKEAEAQIQEISSVMWTRLALLARFQARAVPNLTGEDFLHEAFLRVLDGSRQWPKGLPIDKFFTQVLRSLVSDHWKGLKRKRRQLDVRLAAEIDREDPDDGPTNVIENHPDEAPTPEMTEFVHQAIENFMANLDETARDVLDWQLDGYSKAEIMADFGMDETAYDTITKRIRRSLARQSIKE